MRKRVVFIVVGILAVICIFAFFVGRVNEEGDNEVKKQRIQAIYTEHKKSSFPDAPREGSMIAGAISVDEFERNIERYKDSLVVSYCTIGSRSGHYAEKLREEDLRIFNLKGGILAWAHDGNTVLDAEGETQRIHVFGEKRNLVPEGYEGLW